MKQTPEYDKIQQQMKPGVIALDGFLGDDKRNLIDIIASDNTKVHKLNRTHADIATRMEHFKERGFAGLGEFITLDDHFEVKVESVRGLLPSPFGGKGMYGKVNTTVINKKLDRQIVYTDLHIHFIADHAFYEGKGSPFRLDPQDLIEILEVPEAEE
ncbi:MAG TPA: hypothetical protein DCG32_04375 [Sphaerochaeta sp.]|nr:hypothetical protein [Sphaerochaeta sp.]